MNRFPLQDNRTRRSRDWMVARNPSIDVFDQRSLTGYSGTAQAGSVDTLTLKAAGSPTSLLASRRTLRLTSGSGSVQERQVSAYDGATKVATVSPRWKTNILARSVPNASPWAFGPHLSHAPAAASYFAGFTAEQLTNLGTGSSNDESVNVVIGTGYRTIAVSVYMENVDALSTTVLVFQSVGGKRLDMAYDWSTDVVTSVNGSPTDFRAEQLGTGPNGGKLVRLVLVGPISSAVDTQHLYLYHASLDQNTRQTVVHGVQVEKNVDIGDHISTSGTAIAIPDATTVYEIPLG